MDASSFQFHDKQQVIRDKSASCPHFIGCEIDGGQHVPMRFEKCGPSRLSLPITGRLNAMLFENVTDRCVADVITDVGQSPLDSIETPRPILLGESQHQIHNNLSYTRAARFILMAI